MSKQILEALAVTAELMGNEMSPAAARVMYSDLSVYPENMVLNALVKVRREVKGRLTISDVITRIDEGQSVVWTAEMKDAFFIALPLIQQGDMIGARMAFKEGYTKQVNKAKAEQVPAVWEASLGFDIEGRQSVLNEAVEKGRLTVVSAQSLCHEVKDTMQAVTYNPEGVKKIEALLAEAFPEDKRGEG